MAKKMYVGVSNVAKKARKAYIGINGVAKRIKKMYIGDANGKARQVFGGYDAGQVVFTSSTTWVAPFTGLIDVFVVGAGGPGLGSIYMSGQMQHGAGGGGGYVTTQKNFQVTEGNSYSVVIGAGAGMCANHAHNAGYAVYRSGYSAFDSVQAAGSSCRTSDMHTDFTTTSYTETYGGSYRGRHGGSGGGDGYSGIWDDEKGIDGNSDGAQNWGTVMPTTRAFGDADGTLYAGGGGGGTGGLGGSGGGGKAGYASGNTKYLPEAGSPNTGGGAGGFGYTDNFNQQFTSDSSIKGGSGVVIIRWQEIE